MFYTMVDERSLHAVKHQMPCGLKFVDKSAWWQNLLGFGGTQVMVWIVTLTFKLQYSTINLYRVTLPMKANHKQTAVKLTARKKALA